MSGRDSNAAGHRQYHAPPAPSKRPEARLWRLALAAALALALPAAQAAEVVAAVAANFAAAMARIEPAFEQASGHQLTVVLGSSGKLLQQIQHGAPFDVLLSADVERPALLAKAGLGVPASRFTYAVGRLALWSPDPQAIGDDGRPICAPGRFRHLAIANPAVAPYGVAAQQVLEKLGLWSTVQERIVRGEDIGQVYAMVASGAARGRLRRAVVPRRRRATRQPLDGAAGAVCAAEAGRHPGHPRARQPGGAGVARLPEDPGQPRSDSIARLRPGGSWRHERARPRPGLALAAPGGGHRGAAAADRHAARLVAGAHPQPRETADRGRHRAAAGAAADGARLLSAGAVRARRAARRRLAGADRADADLFLQRPGAGLDALFAALRGAAAAGRLRGGRPRAAGSRRGTGRPAARCLLHRGQPARGARLSDRRCARLRAHAGRVRRGADGGRQHPRPDAGDLDRHLRACRNTRLRRRALALGRPAGVLLHGAGAGLCAEPPLPVQAA